MKPEPIKDMHDVRKYLAKIPHIDNGGCGIAALAMYRWNKKNFRRVPQSIVLCYVGTTEFRNNSRYLSGIPGEVPMAISHAGIIYDDPELGQTMPVDARNFLALPRYDFVHMIKDAAPLVAMLNNREGWNHKFKRHIYVDKIAKRLGIDLSDINKDEWNSLGRTSKIIFEK